MAQNRMTHQALIDQLQGADTDVLRRVLEHAMQRVVAVGVRDTGEKSVLCLAIGASETEAFWLEFCRSLSRRGLSGVQLVISDAHEGLRSALSQVFAGATWQRCKVRFLRNVASAVPKTHAPTVLGVVKSIFLQQPTRATTWDAVHHALSVLEEHFPGVAAKLRAAEHDVVAYLDFPARRSCVIIEDAPRT